MDDYQHVRCLFCNTGQEESVARLIELNGWGKALFPYRVKTILKNKETRQEMTKLLPGYVFAYTQEENAWRRELLGLNAVMRFLRYNENSASETLVGSDRDFADWIWKLGGKIGVMKALEVGDRIVVTDSVFKDMQGKIVKMDKRRRTMKVELSTDGIVKSLWLAYEIVQRVDEENSDWTPMMME